MKISPSCLSFCSCSGANDYSIQFSLVRQKFFTYSDWLQSIAANIMLKASSILSKLFWPFHFLSQIAGHENLNAKNATLRIQKIYTNISPNTKQTAPLHKIVFKNNTHKKTVYYLRFGIVVTVALFSKKKLISTVAKLNSEM